MRQDVLLESSGRTWYVKQQQKSYQPSAFETIWRSLIQDLLDRRHDVNTTDEMFGAICDHLKYATNGGTIKPTITVFRQRKPGQHDLRVWQFFTLSYAGYEGGIGDQGNIEFTKVN